MKGLLLTFFELANTFTDSNTIIHLNELMNMLENSGFNLGKLVLMAPFWYLS